MSCCTRSGSGWLALGGASPPSPEPNGLVLILQSMNPSSASSICGIGVVSAASGDQPSQPVARLKTSSQ